MGWDSALAAADLAVAGYFDTQSFRAIALRKPLHDVNGSSQPDLDRPSFIFRGTLEAEPSMRALGSTEFPSSRHGGDRHVAKLCLSALVAAPVTLESGELAARWPWLPKIGDQIEENGAFYTVSTDPDRDGTDRIVLWLNRGRDARC